MKFLQETTVWTNNMSNGIYLLNDAKSRMFAYVHPGATSVFQFKNPIQIDIRGRTFKVVQNTFDYVIPAESVATIPQWIVKGSKGSDYIVRKDRTSYSCTCTGFGFRGTCKHVTEIQSTNA